MHASQPDAAAIEILTLKMGSLRGNKVPSREWILRINFSHVWFFTSPIHPSSSLSIFSLLVLLTPDTSFTETVGKTLMLQYIIRNGEWECIEDAGWQSAMNIHFMEYQSIWVGTWHKPCSIELTLLCWHDYTDKVYTGPQTAIKVWWLCNFCSGLKNTKYWLVFTDLQATASRKQEQAETVL